MSNKLEGKKRLFIILAFGLLVLYSLIFAAIWFIISLNSQVVNKVLMIGLAAAAILGMMLIGFTLFIVVWSLINHSKSEFLNKLSRKMIDFFAPAIFLMAKILGIEEEAVERSYIKIVNQMNAAKGVHYKPHEILILAPHCLQKVDCPHKITVDVRNCHHCGRCSIDGLLKIADDHGVNLAVASGGTFARKIIKETKPKAVISIACERDLYSGLRDVSKIDVVGILNERPNGPCYNTSVQLCKVSQALDYFLE